MNFRELMNGHNSAVIRCLYSREVVRKLNVEGDTIWVDALSIKVQVPLDSEIRFQPWCMDRGNMLFTCPEIADAKLCTEADILEFPDGVQASIIP